MAIRANSKVVQLSQLEFKGNAQIDKSAAHAVENVKFKGNDDSWFFKPIKQGNGDIERIEAVLGDLFQALLGDDRSPETRVVVNDDEDVIGVMSKELDTYITFNKLEDIFLRNEKRPLPCDDLVLYGLASYLAACYILQENDGHGGNRGFISNGMIAKIDHDQAWWEDTAKFVGYGNLTLNEWKGNDPKSYAKWMGNRYPNILVQMGPDQMVKDLCNNITSHDILYLGNQTSNFPMNSMADDVTDDRLIGLDQMDNYEEFNNDKWSVFLKCHTLKGDKLREILDAHIDKEVDTYLYETLDYHINARMEALEDTLVTIPQFRDYVLNVARPEDVSSEFLEKITDASRLEELYTELETVTGQRDANSSTDTASLDLNIISINQQIAEIGIKALTKATASLKVLTGALRIVVADGNELGGIIKDIGLAETEFTEADMANIKKPDADTKFRLTNAARELNSLYDAQERHPDIAVYEQRFVELSKQIAYIKTKVAAIKAKAGATDSAAPAAAETIEPARAFPKPAIAENSGPAERGMFAQPKTGPPAATTGTELEDEHTADPTLQNTSGSKGHST